MQPAGLLQWGVGGMSAGLLATWKKDDLDVKKMIELGLVKSKEKVKILAKGDFKSKLNIKCHKFSLAAKKIIEENGGSIELIEK